MMKRELLPTAVGLVSMILIPRTAHAHGGAIISNVTGAVFTMSALLVLAVLTGISVLLLRSSSISRWRAAYGLAAVILSVAVIAVLLVILMLGESMGFAYGAVVIVAGWWSIRLSSRLVRKNFRRGAPSESAR